MSKQQRKAAKKRKRSERDRLNGSKRAKRQAILDKPPTTLRLIDDLLLGRVDLPRFTHPLFKDLALSTSHLLREGVIAGTIPVFFVDDVDQWLDPGSSPVIKGNYKKDTGEFKCVADEMWFEYRRTINSDARQWTLQGGAFVKYFNVQEYPVLAAAMRNDGDTPPKVPVEATNALVIDIFGGSINGTQSVSANNCIKHTVFLDDDAGYIDQSIAIHWNDKHLMSVGENKEAANMVRSTMHTVDIVLASIDFLNAHNIDPIVKQVEHTKAEKKYAEAARKPLPQYEQRVIDLWPGEQRTVHVGGEGGEGGGGGKHRWHSVRGHFARSKLGKRFWRQGHSRGDKRLGVVQKRTRIRLKPDGETT